MSNVPLIFNDEIDLLDLIVTIWDGKWKIASIVAVSLLSVFSFNIIKPNTSFIATTEIKPITSFEFDKYRLFNSYFKIIKKEEKEEEENKFNNFEISQESLLNFYIENIEEGSLLETGIDKYNLINKDDFESESDYKQAIEKFASKIEVLRPIKEKNETRLYHVLSAKYNDKNKWKQLLLYLNIEANKNVKNNIINHFKTTISIQNQKKDFALEDLDIKIDNTKKDYATSTKNRLAFLAEQAAIARKLGIKKNTISSQTFNAQNTFVTNVKTDAPFYLRGFLAIEEEIKQITTRKDKSLFTDDLFKLEQKKRDLAQDETIKRTIELFNKTPLNQTDFQATIVKEATTDFKINNKKNLYYALAIVLGGIIGVVYVLIAYALRNRRTLLTNS